MIAVAAYTMDMCFVDLSSLQEKHEDAKRLVHDDCSAAVRDILKDLEHGSIDSEIEDSAGDGSEDGDRIAMDAEIEEEEEEEEDTCLPPATRLSAASEEEGQQEEREMEQQEGGGSDVEEELSPEEVKMRELLDAAEDESNLPVALRGYKEPAMYLAVPMLLRSMAGDSSYSQSAELLDKLTSRDLQPQEVQAELSKQMLGLMQALTSPPRHRLAALAGRMASLIRGQMEEVQQMALAAAACEKDRLKALSTKGRGKFQVLERLVQEGPFKEVQQRLEQLCSGDRSCVMTVLEERMQVRLGWFREGIYGICRGHWFVPSAQMHPGSRLMTPWREDLHRCYPLQKTLRRDCS
jgi:hypothetical protein